MSTRRALLFSFVDRYGGLVLSIMSSMVIARLLTPADLGVFSAAAALMTLAGAVRDMGAGQYLVQSKQLDDNQIRAVWTIQMGIGILLAIVVAALAVPAAAFYREPRITPVLLVMALTFLVNPFGAITYAMLMRQMRFQHVAVMRFSSNLVGPLLSVVLAYQGWGPVSLAIGALASTATNALAAQFFRDRSMPWGFTFSGLKRVVAFGSRIAGAQVVNSVLWAMPDFLLPRLQNVHAAGIYSRSNGLVSMFNRLVTDAILPVAVAMFSAQNRAGKPVADGLLRALSYLTVLNWAFAINLFLLADPLTVALYGSQWGESVEITRILAIAGAFLAPVPICQAVTTALGRADRVFSASLALGIATAAAALLGASISLRAMALAVTVTSLLSGVTWLLLTCRLAQCAWANVARVLGRSALVATLCATVPLATVGLFGWHPAAPWSVIIGAASVGGLVLVGALLVTGHPLAQEVRPLLRKLSPRR